MDSDTKYTIMKKNIISFFKTTFTFALLTIILLIANGQIVSAQTIETDSKVSKFEPFRRDVTITVLSGNINWLKFCSNCRFSASFDNNLYIEL